MEKLDLWGNILDNANNAEPILSFIKEQAKLLSEKTQGIVLAKFEKIKYTYKANQTVAMATMLSSLTTKLAAVHDYSGKKVEIEDDENLEDASKFFQSADYKFESYSKKYKFRLFTLKYKSIFPVEIEVEYGILDEKITKLSINSKDELENKLIEIFSSAKVKFIINKMIADNKN